MAAPSPTTRGTPSGRKLRDGFRSLITFARNTTVSLWEMSIKPPGRDGGEPIDTTTMHNVSRRTRTPRALVTTTPGSVKFAYDPKLKTQIEALINQPDTITVRYKDGSTEAFYGFMKDLEFDELQEGAMPTGTCNFVPTDFDETNNVEADPAISEVAGT